MMLKYFPQNFITFSQHGVDSGAHHLAVGSLDGLLVGVLGVGRVVRDVVALGLQLSDALQQLGDGGRDVGQLDDVPLGGLGQLSQSSQLIRDPLLRCESLGEVSNETASNRNVSLLNLTKRTYRDMSLQSEILLTSIPMGLANLWMTGRREKVASMGASSVSV